MIIVIGVRIKPLKTFSNHLNDATVKYLYEN